MNDISLILLFQPRQMDRGGSRMQGNPSKPTEQQPTVVGAESASSEQEKVKDMDDEMEGDDVTKIADANACASSSSSSNSLR